jgi:hypothetical protein
MRKVLITTPTFAKYSAEAPAILAAGGLEVVRAAQPVKSDGDLMGYLDDVVEPKETRARIISALATLREKSVTPLARKHGNIPL